MSTANAVSRGMPNPGAARSCGRNTKACGWSERLASKFRELWPRKTAQQLAAEARVSLRTAEYWLSGARGPDGEDLVALLHSDHGNAYLKEIMRGCRADWWLDAKRTMDIADLRRRQEQTKRDLERLEREFVAGGDAE